MRKIKNPQIRYLNELRKVLYDKQWAKTASNFGVYYMWREIRKKKGIKQNITFFPPSMLGKEFAKTKGHEHKGNYGEVYKVTKGKAIFLMQKRRRDSKKIEDVYAVKTNRNEVAVIPSGYGHITINPTDRALKTMDWSYEKCESDYSFFEKMRGACYFYTKSGWIKNKNYKKIPRLHFEKPLKKLSTDLSFLKRDVRISR
jgi:glucose-6-phosphate isomerase